MCMYLLTFGIHTMCSYFPLHISGNAMHVVEFCLHMCALGDDGGHCGDKGYRIAGLGTVEKYN